MQNMKKYGYSKIISVEVQRFTDLVPCGDGLYTEQTTGEYIWIKTNDGIFADEPRIGEDAEEIAAMYRKRGWTNDRSVFFK